MTDTLENASRNNQTRRGSVREASSKGATDFSKECGAQYVAEVSYPAEIMPVGDPRPQNN